jgi:membrane protease YdiL (CAAX protease family)
MNVIQKGPLKIDWKTPILTIVSTLLIIIDYYYQLTPWKMLDRTILYLFIPLAVIIFIFKEKPGDFGFRLGNWKLGLLLTFVCIILIAPVLWIVTQANTNMQGYYQEQLKGLPWTTFADLLGWEFIFRGWLLFGYSRKFGSDALWLQAVPFALAHIGKPDIETLSTIFGGFVFGWVAWKTNSFLYPFLIHWFVATFTIIIAAGLLG